MRMKIMNRDGDGDGVDVIVANKEMKKCHSMWWCCHFSSELRLTRHGRRAVVFLCDTVHHGCVFFVQNVCVCVFGERMGMMMAKRLSVCLS